MITSDVICVKQNKRLIAQVNATLTKQLNKLLSNY